MPLSDPADPDRLCIEQWSGTFNDANEALYESWLDLFGHASAVALQILSRRYGDMVKAASSVQSGTDRVNHTKNMERMEAAIGDLVSWMNANIADLGLTEAGRKLLSGASSGATETTIVVDTLAGNRRRG